MGCGAVSTGPGPGPVAGGRQVLSREWESLLEEVAGLAGDRRAPGDAAVSRER